MYSAIYVAFAAALAVLVAADYPNAFKVPAGGYNFKTGVPADLSWNPTTQGTVTLKLQWGSPTGMDTGMIIACKVVTKHTYARRILIHLNYM